MNESAAAKDCASGNIPEVCHKSFGGSALVWRCLIEYRHEGLIWLQRLVPPSCNVLPHSLSILVFASSSIISHPRLLFPVLSVSVCVSLSACLHVSLSAILV